MSEEANYSGDKQQEAAAPTSNSVNEVSTSNDYGNDQVPLSALQEERSKRQQMAEELQMMKDHLSLLEQRTKVPQEKPKDIWDSLPDDDIPTWGEFKKVMSQKERQLQASYEELRVAQKYPDYQEVITKYLPNVLKENPRWAKVLESNPDYELAYDLAKKSDHYRAEHKKAQKNADAEKVIQNSTQAGSLSSMGTNTPINAAKRYREMTDEDFRREVNRNMGYA